MGTIGIIEPWLDGSPGTNRPIQNPRNSPEQHIQHFGASDAWSMQFLGLWPEKQQQKIADWLFSMENDAQGKPKGIGLSIWRFNLGAGSEEQGDSSQIQRGTRTQCFLNRWRM